MALVWPPLNYAAEETTNSNAIYPMSYQSQVTLPVICAFPSFASLCPKKVNDLPPWISTARGSPVSSKISVLKVYFIDRQQFTI